jgi:predicted permease
MYNFLQDVRYGLRMLRRKPGFTFVVILTLAVSIGANTAVFSAVNGVLLSSLPFPNPEQLVSIYCTTPKLREAPCSFPNFVDWQKENHTFADMAVHLATDYSLTGAGEPEELHGWKISSQLISVLGIKPILGRAFLPQEDEIGGQPVALVSEGLWKRKFGGSSNILRQSLTLSGKSYAIVGVVPGGLPTLESVEVFTPIGQWTDPTFHDRKVAMGSVTVGRLKPTVNILQAQADMELITRNLAAAYPDADKNIGVRLVPLNQTIIKNIREILLMLMGAVGFVLLIACSNVANLLLARSVARSPEFALRMFLGANRNRIIRQMLTESLLLAIAGGVLGLAIAFWGIHAILAGLPSAIPRAANIQLDGHVLFFTFALSMITGLGFGLAPALKMARGNLTEVLKEGGRGLSGGHHRAQHALVVGEIALSLVLLVGSGLMVRTMFALLKVNPGFDPHNVLTFAFKFSPGRLSTPELIRESLRDLAAKLDSVPGVGSASAMMGSLPMNGGSGLPFWLDGQPKPASQSEMNVAAWCAVQPDYISAMRISLIRGRFFSPQDTDRSSMVAVIDENFAQQYFGAQDPIGKRIHIGIIGVEAEIVGIVGHVNNWGLGATADQNRRPEFYSPLLQLPDRILSLVAQGGTMVVRTSGVPAAFSRDIRNASMEFDPSQVLYEFKPMEKIVSNSIVTQRFTTILLGVFAILALILSSVGIYALISHVVDQRTNEIGLRMALGAERRNILSMVLIGGMRITLIGIVMGIIGSLALNRLMAKVVYRVGLADPGTFLFIVAVLVIVTFIACFLPARRAIDVDPLVALRRQ